MKAIKRHFYSYSIQQLPNLWACITPLYLCINHLLTALPPHQMLLGLLIIQGENKKKSVHNNFDALCGAFVFTEF